MPEPVRGDQKYLPGLDGLRALAVTAAGAGLASGAGVSLSAPRAVACVLASVALAAASWRFVEEPARLGFRRARRSGPGRRLLPRLAAWLSAAWFAVWLSAAWLTGSLGVHRLLPASPLAAGGMCLVLAAGVVAGVTVVTSRLASGAGRPAATAGRPAMAAGLATAGGTQRQADPSARAVAARTSCRSVVHIRDSTSDGLISPDYLPNPAERITARYAQVGVRHSIMEVTGGTSIVETIDGTPDAYQVAKRLIGDGYRGCWVLALGTNDTADVYAGSNVGRIRRITEMMSLIGDQPVLWIEVKSLVPGGPYAEQNMRLWNRALARERPHYPTMRLYDWPAVVRASWFIDDGIHYTSYGYAQRARLIADALAAAFPAP